MNLQIDNYYISVSSGENKYIKVCIDGQNIIHERFMGNVNRKSVADVGINLIEKYNARNKLKWGYL